MAIEKEIWISDIQENLFATNEFVQRGTDHSQFIDNKTVHVPQAGANPTVEKDRAVVPATITQRTDTDLTYNMSEFTTDPILVRDIEDLQVNYSKRNSVIGNHVSALGDTIGNHVAYAWGGAGAGRIIRTSGAVTGNALAPSATLTRKAITLADIANARGVLDKDNVPMSGRILLLDSDIYNNQLLAIPDAYQAQSYGQSALPSGVIARMFGFDIMIRPTVTVYDAAGTPVIKAIDDDGTPTAPAATDNIGCLAFHPNFVSQAVGSTKVFFQEDAPAYYGSYFSGLQMFGASKLRTDQKGLVSIVQIS